MSFTLIPNSRHCLVSHCRTGGLTDGHTDFSVTSWPYIFGAVSWTDCTFYYMVWCSYTWNSLAWSWLRNDTKWSYRIINAVTIWLWLVTSWPYDDWWDDLVTSWLVAEEMGMGLGLPKTWHDRLDNENGPSAWSTRHMSSELINKKSTRHKSSRHMSQLDTWVNLKAHTEQFNCSAIFSRGVDWDYSFVVSATQTKTGTINDDCML